MNAAAEAAQSRIEAWATGAAAQGTKAGRHKNDGKKNTRGGAEGSQNDRLAQGTGIHRSGSEAAE
jgi:hypothetical protein